MSLVGTRPILQDELQKYELHHRAKDHPAIDEPPNSGNGHNHIVQAGDKICHFKLCVKQLTIQ